MIVVTVPDRGEFTLEALNLTKIGEALVLLPGDAAPRWVPRDWVRPA